MNEKKTVVELENVTISQKENVILKDVNLSLQAGDFVYLIGKTGSGKSSLLKTLYAELALKEGEGSVCDYNLRSIRKKKVPFLRRKLGIVFQDFELLSDRSVNNNLKFVLRATGWKKKADIEKRIEEVLSLVGMDTKGYKLPHELSGGEQQRVAIARAILNEPELILADEPTGNLDPATTEGILELLHNISQNGKTVLMATHDYAFMKKYAGRTITCVNNTIEERNLVPLA